MRAWWKTVLVITDLELRQRVRSKGWRYSLAVLFTVLSLVVFGSLYLMVGGGSSYAGWAKSLYTIVVCAVLFLGIIIAPTLSATSINGDRRDSTLAMVQATPISNWQLATGKLLGGWAASMALPALATPYLIWAMIEAPCNPGYCLLGAVVVALLLGCYCGLGLGFSALAARPTSSAVLTQFAVLFLVLGLPAAFGLLSPATRQDHEIPWTDSVRVRSAAETGTWAQYECRPTSRATRLEHTERIWWLLAPEPFLIVNDIVGAHEPDTTRYSDVVIHRSITRDLASAVSSARSGPYLGGIHCGDAGRRDAEARNAHDDAYLGRSWYWGLAATVLLGATGFTLAARRLRVPAGKLPRGVRLA